MSAQKNRLVVEEPRKRRRSDFGSKRTGPRPWRWLARKAAEKAWLLERVRCLDDMSATEHGLNFKNGPLAWGPPLPSKMITPAGLARIMDVGERTVATWTGGRKRKPQIDLVRVGHVIRFSPEAVLKFILRHTVRSSNGGVYQLSPEQMDLLWARIERLIELSLTEKISGSAQERTCLPTPGGPGNAPRLRPVPY